MKNKEIFYSGDNAGSGLFLQMTGSAKIRVNLPDHFVSIIPILLKDCCTAVYLLKKSTSYPLRLNHDTNKKIYAPCRRCLCRAGCWSINSLAPGYYGI